MKRIILILRVSENLQSKFVITRRTEPKWIHARGHQTRVIFQVTDRTIRGSEQNAMRDFY